MKPLARIAIASALLVGLTTFCRQASAGNTRVVVAAKEGDPVAVRLQKELVAMGFEPVRVDDAAGCSRAAIAAWVEEMHASGATCTDGSTVGVWVVGKSGLRLADTVSPREGDDAAPDLLAVRAAETARASLELPGAEAADAALPPSKPPPTWSKDSLSPEVDAGLRRRDRAPAAAPLPRTPTATLAAGASAVMGADVTAAAFDMELDIRLARYVALATRAAIVPGGATVSSGRSTVEVAPNVFGIGPIFALASQDSFAIPRLGGGVGLVWLRTSPVTAQPSFSGDDQSSFGTRSDSIVSPLAYANAAVSLRVSGPFRLAFDAMLGTTAHRMVVRTEGQHLAYWGQPFGALAFRAELLFR